MVCANKILNNRKCSSTDGCLVIDTSLNNHNQEQWLKPQLNQLNANVDADLFKEKNCFGFGCLVRDHRGFLIQAISNCSQGARTLLEAEAIGVKQVLSWIKLNGWDDVIVDSDCLTVLQAIQSSIVMVSSFGSIIPDHKALLADFRSVCVNFINDL